MVYGNISKEKAINIVSKILCKNDPAGLCINDAQGDEYISEAKALADELDKKSNFFFFWIDIHDVILNKLGKDINKKLCKKIAHEIDESFSLCSFADIIPYITVSLDRSFAFCIKFGGQNKYY